MEEKDAAPDPQAALEKALAENPSALMMWDDKGHVALNWPVIENYAQAWRLGVKDHANCQWCYALVAYRDRMRAEMEAAMADPRRNAGAAILDFPGRMQ